jgi:hypothetical protein
LEFDPFLGIPVGFRGWIAGLALFELSVGLGSGLIDQIQKMTAAAMQMAEK